MSRTLDETIQRAAATGLLPADTISPDVEARPWPVVLLTALGAWLAAIPLILVAGFLLHEIVRDSVGAYGVGLLVLAVSVAALRMRTLPLFVEQLAVPGLLVGVGTVALGLFRDMPDRRAALLLAAMALALVLMLERPWLRVLLGASLAGLIAVVLFSNPFWPRNAVDADWLAGHALLLAWVLAQWWQQRTLETGPQARNAAALEAAGAGWLLVTLVGLAWLAGMSFLLGTQMDGALATRMASRGAALANLQAVHFVSAALCLLGAAMAVRAWPSLRQPALAGAALVAAALSLLLPTLGAVLLVLALTATRHRFRLAAAAGLAAVWIVGSFYYQLDWTLAHKAAVLVLAAALLGLLAWWMVRGASAAPVPDEAATWRFDRGARWLAFGTVATLAVAVFGIWQKEQLIRHGQSVFLELQPVDPRSLMQGDYMRLGFLSRRGSSLSEIPQPGVAAARPWAVVRTDARGVASVLRIVEAGSALAEGEFPIELTAKNGSWTFVTDAWFFKEGEAGRWAEAKYGEFRVGADGKALLVGMADAALHPIHP